MENQDFYNNNHRLRGQQQQQQQGSRADRASSWRSSQRSPLPGTARQRKQQINETIPAGMERLNAMYNTTSQQDDRVSSWCTDVQRHRLASPSSAGFTVFTDNQINTASPVQPSVGSCLSSRDHPGLTAMSPFLQSMQLPSPVNMIQLAGPPPPSGSMQFASADVRAQSAGLAIPPSNAGPPQMNFGAFSQRASESTQLSQSFSPWPATGANALQLRDANQQQNILMVHKHNEIGIKAKDQRKLAAPFTPTWSQVAAREPQQLPSCNSSATVLTTANAKRSTVQTVRTVPATSFVKEDMDLDMAEASATPSGSFQNTAVDSQARGSRYITDSLAFISSGVSNDQNISMIRPYTVLKIKNISWNVSSSDIYGTLSRHKTLKLPNVTELPQCIHIFMDVNTGKTMNTAYVELKMNVSSPAQIDSLISNIVIPQAQGRHITVTRSSYDELCNDLFSEWNGSFTDGMAYPHTDSRDSSATQRSRYYIGQRELQRLLNVCRFFKTYYNRKCAERPFEFLITIIMNMPWKQPRTVTTAQRDIIYECYKLATEALYKHVNRPYHSFDDELLPRMVRAAVICDGFTVKQKKVVLGNAHMECPPDLESYMQEPILSTAGFTDFLR